MTSEDRRPRRSSRRAHRTSSSLAGTPRSPMARCSTCSSETGPPANREALQTMNAIPSTASAMPSTATGATANAAASPATGPENPNGELGKNAFLKLMVAQLKAQNPLDPANGNEYVAELAQFSQLEQMTNLAEASSKADGAAEGRAGRAADRAYGLLRRSLNRRQSRREGPERRDHLLGSDADRRRNGRHRTRQHHGGLVSVQENAALQATRPARANQARRAAPAARDAAPTGPLFAEVLRDASVEAARQASNGASAPGHARPRPRRRRRRTAALLKARPRTGSPPRDLTRPRHASAGCARASAGLPARAPATRSYLSTAPPSWCPSTTAPSSRRSDPEHMREHVFTNIDSAVIA